MATRWGAGVKSRGVQIVRSLPVLLPVGLTAFGVVAMVLLLLNQFDLVLLLVCGLPAATVAEWVAYRCVTRKEAERARQSAFVDIVAIFGIFLWGVLNIPLSAQHILTDRDPATYAVAGVWLTTHHSLHIPVLSIVHAMPGLTGDSLGFNTSRLNPNEIYAQGAHLLPALLGTAGKLFGQSAMLHFNVLFGVVALLAFYSFVRQVLKPWWSIMATMALAFSLPFVFFSRDTYTEPLTLMLVFTTLTLLMYGMHTRQRLLWALAGITAGASTLLRIDTYVFLAALEAFWVWYLLFATKDERLERVRQVLAMALPTVILGILGWLDVSQLSSGYYHDLHPQIIAQFYFIGILTVLGALAVAVGWKTSLVSWFRQRAGDKRVITGAQLVLAVFFIGLIMRAIWFFGLAVTGRAQGMPVEEYARDTTITWILWYIGPLLGITGMIGFVVGWSRLLRGRMGWMVPFFVVMSAECALYLLNPQISADQVYASRRFLPIIFPAFTMLGVMVVQQSVQRLERYAVHPRLFKGLIVLTVIAALLGPTLTTLPFVGMRPYTELALTQSLCRALPRNALVIWVGQEGGFATQPTQAFCHVASISTTVQNGRLRSIAIHVAAISSKTGYVPYFAASGSDAALLEHFGTLQTVGPITYVEPEHTYKKFPVHAISHTRSFVFVRLTTTTKR